MRKNNLSPTIVSPAHVAHLIANRKVTAFSRMGSSGFNICAHRDDWIKAGASAYHLLDLPKSILTSCIGTRKFRRANEIAEGIIEERRSALLTSVETLLAQIDDTYPQDLSELMKKR